MKKNNYIVPFLLMLCCLFFSEMKAQEEYYSKVSVDINDTSVLGQLVNLGMAIDHYEYLSDNTLGFYVTQSELQTLQQEQIPFSMVIANYEEYYQKQKEDDAAALSSMVRSANVGDGFDLGSMGGFYTYDEVVDKLDEMVQDYPNLVTAKTSIGTSAEGREIWMVKISDNPNVDEPEPTAYFDALHHAREPLSMATTINYMFWLLENYETNAQVQFLIDHREIYFVPVVNPDGYEYNRATNPNGGGLWRKNRNPNDGTCFGVDLNRNYGFGYANNNSCSSPDPCSGVYRGEEAFSEPETAAVRDLMTLINPKTAFSTHSTAGSYLMPYGYDASPPAFSIYSEWASVFLSENDYPYGVTAQMLGYTSCGVTRDYLHSEGIYAWTPEIAGSGFWPPESTIFDLVAENVFPMFYQSWIAGAYVDVQSHQILGDAILGDSFALVVEVKNVGVGADAENVTVQVSSSDTGITLSGPVNYGTIPLRERAANQGQPFTVSIDAGFDADFFTLKLVTFQDGVINDILEIPVYVGEKEQLFFDDASAGDGQWIASGNGDPWGEVMDDAYSGTTCFGDSNGGNGANGTLNYFELIHTFDFSGTTTPSVSFMAKYALEQDDFVDFQISVDEGVNWETLRNFTLSEPWTPYFISLHNYADASSARFRFMMQTDGSIPADGFYFDDFDISNYDNVILETESFHLENTIVVQPNPFSNEIEIAWNDGQFSEMPEVALYDIQGRKMRLSQAGSATSLLISEMDTFSSGVYFLKITAKDKVVKTFRMIKQ
ncbi:MAG: M14 family zinc carboxypeptidase [Bacteroidota bacterium]